MTQLELPQISFARYVDLLKRRKWQVVPVSLLGMIVGGLIAASVPRYYVASTVIHFNAEHLLSDRSKGLVDPLEEMLASARPLLEAQVPDVLRQLGWQEAMVDDLDQRAQFIAETTSRIGVNDLGSTRRNRVNTDLGIVYRDTDGRRAAEFTNALREHWISKRMGDLERVFDEDVQRVSARQTDAQEAVGIAERELANFERERGLDPSLRGNSQFVEGTLQARLQEDRDREAAQLLGLNELDGRIEGLRQRLEGDVPQKVPAPPPALDPGLAAELTDLEVRIVRYKLQLRWVHQVGSPGYQYTSAMLAALQEEKRAKMPVVTQALVPNPEYLAVQRQLDALTAERRGRQGQLEELRQRIAATEAEIRARPTLMAEYGEKQRALARASARLGAIEAELDRVTAAAQQVRASRPFTTLREAVEPPRPTEPNITLLALLGSLIGLAVAVGLIFALDAMRFTFKTLDDVERGLPVPLLGGISHVETHVERSHTRRNRVLVSGIAFTLLFLVVALATIYYVAPARLPSWVRDALDLVLGGPE